MLHGQNPQDAEAPNEDAIRHMENKVRYGALYDAWDYESPAYMSAEVTQEIRDWLKKGGDV